MKQSPSLPRLQLIGFLFTSLGGSLLHFVYDWTNQSLLAAPFSAVNESTWEHMKLLFFPMFVFALVENRFSAAKRDDFWCVKLAGIVTGLTMIPVLFYTGSGVFGPLPDWLNITIFFLSAAVAYLLETRLFRTGRLRCRHPWFAFAAICLILLAFVHFTFFPPELPLFQDPLTGTYGLQK